MEFRHSIEVISLQKTPLTLINLDTNGTSLFS